MRGYGQYCPVAKAAEVLGDRWSMLIVREMLYGVEHFNDLERGLPGISRSVLAERLRQLTRAGIIAKDVAGGRTSAYRLTPAGRELKDVLMRLGEWAARWTVGEPDPAELDADLLLLFMSRQLNVDRLPPRRVALRFDLRGARRRTLWLVIEDGEASVCAEAPGGREDLVIGADTLALYRVYSGLASLREELKRGTIVLDGPAGLGREFVGWFAWSPFATAARAGQAAAR